MVRWLWGNPSLTRWGGLAAAIGVLAAASRAYGLAVDWGTALIYGLALALSSRWPIVMPSTGARVVLLTGLLLEAAWNRGLPTALLVVLLAFGLQLVVLYRRRYSWAWYQPLLAAAAVTLAYAAAVAIAGDLPGSPVDWGASWLDLGAFALAYGYWALVSVARAVRKAPVHGTTWPEEFGRIMQQTWWAPLLFLGVAWLLDLTHRPPYPLVIPVVLALLWVQAQVGTVFTTLHQDRAVARLIRTSPAPDPAAQAESHQVLLLVHALGRALALSSQEIRIIGYAALLQDLPRLQGRTLPRWLPDRPTPEEREAISRYVAEAARRVEQEGALQEVAELIRFRYAAHDGQGFPEAAAGALPTGAQVLAAANAIVHVMGLRGCGSGEAVAWLHANRPSRFSRELLEAMIACQREPDVARWMEQRLPGTVRQLQTLVAGGERPSTFYIGLRRIWLQLRGNVPLAPSLPQEVQAMAELAHFFASSTDSAETARIAVKAVGQLVGAKVALALADQEGDPMNMRFIAVHGFDQMDLTGRPVAVFGGEMSRAILNQTPVQIADLRELTSGLAHEIARTEGIHSILYVPLVGRGRTIGVMIVGMQGYHWFTPREVGLIHLMAGQAATALENARLIAEVEDRLARISELKALTDALLDNLSTGIIVVDAEGRLMLANATARHLFGDVVCETGSLLPQELADVFQVRRALAGEAAPECDRTWGTAMLEVQAIPLKDGHGVNMGAICLARDVTHVREMEQHVRRVEKLAAVGQLAAGAAHEIRNPLTSIRGFIQLLQAKGAQAQQEYFKIILSEIDRIDRLINDLLLLARPAEMQREPTALPDLIEELILLRQQEFDQQSITVVREFSPEVGPVPVDPKSIRQLLYNLTNNAVEAMPHGGRLTYRVRPAGNDRVALEVADTGVGIPSKQLKRLFVPFFTTKEQGTGLGLALCYSIVEAHKGRIDVQSEVGVGTTFTIYLPAR